MENAGRSDTRGLTRHTNSLQTKAHVHKLKCLWSYFPPQKKVRRSLWGELREMTLIYIFIREQCHRCQRGILCCIVSVNRGKSHNHQKAHCWPPWEFCYLSDILGAIKKKQQKRYALPKKCLQNSSSFAFFRRYTHIFNQADLWPSCWLRCSLIFPLFLFNFKFSRRNRAWGAESVVDMLSIWLLAQQHLPAGNICQLELWA